MLPTMPMGKNLETQLKEGLKLEKEDFEPRWTAD